MRESQEGRRQRSLEFKKVFTLLKLRTLQERKRELEKQRRFEPKTIKSSKKNRRKRIMQRTGDSKRIQSKSILIGNVCNRSVAFRLSKSQ